MLSLRINSQGAVDGNYFHLSAMLAMPNIGEYIIPAVIGWAVGSILSNIWPPIGSFVSGVFSLPYKKIASNWNTEYKEKDENGNLVTSYEAVKIFQFMGFLRGEITSKSDPKNNFVFHGFIKKNIVNCTFKGKASESLVGSGAFQLALFESKEIMSGIVHWFDKDHNCVDSSKYKWIKA